jgi:Phage integrase family
MPPDHPSGRHRSSTERRTSSRQRYRPRWRWPTRSGWTSATASGPERWCIAFIPTWYTRLGIPGLVYPAAKALLDLCADRAPEEITLQQVAEEYDMTDPVTVYLARLTSAESRRAMAASLELLAELLVDGQPADRAERARRREAGAPLAMAVPWHELRYGYTQALRSWLAEHCSPAAANRHLAALRGVLREAWRLGLMNGEDLARAVDLASVQGTSLPSGRYVEDGEVRRLVAACLADQSPGGKRDAAVLAALFVGGLRRAEAVALDVDNYDTTTGYLTVTGKGRRQRRTALPAGGRRAMASWLEVRGFEEEGPLFCPSTRPVESPSAG